MISTILKEQKKLIEKPFGVIGQGGISGEMLCKILNACGTLTKLKMNGEESTRSGDIMQNSVK